MGKATGVQDRGTKSVHSVYISLCTMRQQELHSDEQFNNLSGRAAPEQLPRRPPRLADQLLRDART